MCECCLHEACVPGDDDSPVGGGDHGLKGVRQRADEVRGEGVTEHVRHQDLGGRGNTWDRDKNVDINITQDSC